MGSILFGSLVISSILDINIPLASKAVAGHTTFKPGILENKLSGMLTKYPLNKGVWDWACENNMHNLKAEKVTEKSLNPNFIAGFTTASQEHYHYEDGIKKS